MPIPKQPTAAPPIPPDLIEPLIAFLNQELSKVQSDDNNEHLFEFCCASDAADEIPGILYAILRHTYLGKTPDWITDRTEEMSSSDE